MTKSKPTINWDLFKKVLTLIDESWGNEDIELLVQVYDLNKLS
jgi:hypothetical protein